MEEHENNYAETIAREARKPIRLDVSVEGLAHYAIPEGYTVDVRDLLKDDPKRMHGTVQLDTVASFIAYLKSPSGSCIRVYCRADFVKGQCQMVGVLNDHDEAIGAAGYRDHRALYSPKQTLEWATWIGANKKPMGQGDFATFIEDNMRDIATVTGLPTGSEMFAMARELEINRDARIKSAIRPQSGGVTLEYVDTDDDATVKRMQVFERFALGIKPFLEGAAYQVDARLRYRFGGGAVTFWYELIRPDLTIAAAVNDEIAKVIADAKVPVLMGALA